MAYPSIAGSGPDSCFLHWEKNNRQMKDGEVLLNDSGAEYGLYATDITRTYPVNGRFSAEQRAIYEIVLEAQKKAMAQVKPGLPHAEIENACARIQIEGLLRLGLLSGDAEKILKDRSDRRLTLHGVSHWVGLDVHDAGRYTVNGQPRALEPGMVFTIEPGIYIPANTVGHRSEVVEHRRADRGHGARHAHRLRMPVVLPRRARSPTSSARSSRDGNRVQSPKSNVQSLKRRR